MKKLRIEDVVGLMMTKEEIDSAKENASIIALDALKCSVAYIGGAWQKVKVKQESNNKQAITSMVDCVSRPYRVIISGDESKEAHALYHSLINKGLSPNREGDREKFRFSILRSGGLTNPATGKVYTRDELKAGNMDKARIVSGIMARVENYGEKDECIFFENVTDTLPLRERVDILDK